MCENSQSAILCAIKDMFCHVATNCVVNISVNFQPAASSDKLSPMTKHHDAILPSQKDYASFRDKT